MILQSMRFYCRVKLPHVWHKAYVVNTGNTYALATVNQTYLQAYMLQASTPAHIHMCNCEALNAQIYKYRICMNIRQITKTFQTPLLVLVRQLRFQMAFGLLFIKWTLFKDDLFALAYKHLHLVYIRTYVCYI